MNNNVYSQNKISTINSKINLNKDKNFGNSLYKNMSNSYKVIHENNQNVPNFINSYSLDDRAQLLDIELSEIFESISKYNTEKNSLNIQNNTISNILHLKGNEVDSTLKEEIEKIDIELTKHFDHQKIENNRIRNFIDQIKIENVTLTNQIRDINKRINELWNVVGLEINHNNEDSDDNI